MVDRTTLADFMEEGLTIKVLSLIGPLEMLLNHNARCVKRLAIQLLTTGTDLIESSHLPHHPSTTTIKDECNGCHILDYF